MNKSKQIVSILNDQAIGEGTSFESDGLGFEIYAEIIGSAVLNSKTPFTVGIFGEWGTGKTSLMRIIERFLLEKGQKDVVSVWFNAWRFEKDEHPLIPLVAHIVQEVRKKDSFLSSISDGGKSIIDALRAVAYGISTKAKLSMPGFAEIEAAFVAKDMIERSDRFTSDPLLDRSLYYNAFSALSNIKIGSKQRIVIIIDDLDRCFPDMALRLLESIKLIFSQSGFVFIIGASRTVLEGYIEHRYHQEYGLFDFDGRSYFDKIIQLSFFIPPNTGRIKNFSESIINRITDIESKKEIASIINIVEISCSNNPRAMVRFVNNLLIDRAINIHLSKDDETYNKIGIGYFAITRSLQQNWRQVFELLIKSKELCYLLSAFENMAEIDQTFLEKVVPANKMDLIESMLGDDDLQKVLYSKSGIEWLRDENFRITATEFILSKRTETNLAEPIKEIEKSIQEYIANKKGTFKRSTRGTFIDYDEAVRRYTEIKRSETEQKGKGLIDMDEALKRYLEQQKRLKNKDDGSQ